VEFQINTIIKWEEKDSIEVTTPRDSATCGFQFEQWKDYIVYTYLDVDNNKLSVSLCSRTTLLKNASEDLAVLNILNTPPNDENWDLNDNNFEPTENNSYSPLNVKNEKNVYIWISISLLALILIIFCMISMNKKD
jgi:hypothetical protein